MGAASSWISRAVRAAGNPRDTKLPRLVTPAPVHARTSNVNVPAGRLITVPAEAAPHSCPVNTGWAKPDGVTRTS